MRGAELYTYASAPLMNLPLRQRVSTPSHPDKTRNLPCLPLEPSGPDCLLPLAETPQISAADGDTESPRSRALDVSIRATLARS